MDFLSMAGVDIARGDKVVLHDVNLRIASGEHIAILGPNGCGKSTLIKAITCECYPIVRPGHGAEGLRSRPLGRAATA